MTTVADGQASLEANLKDEILRMYQEVADQRVRSAAVMMTALKPAAQ